MTETEIEFSLEVILCKKCRHFEDMGLKTMYFYDSKGHVKGKHEVRYYCHRYREYLSKLYSKCLKFEPEDKPMGRK